MVDNEGLQVGKADAVKQETGIPLACCCSADSAFSPVQTSQISSADSRPTAVENDGQGSDAVNDTEDDQSAAASSVDKSDDLRHIVIDGSNIAMRFYFCNVFVSLRE